MLQGFILAFSRYSIFPMPEIRENKKEKIAAAFLPFVGLAIAAFIGICLYFLPVFHFSRLFISITALLLPLLLTGGLHLDGFIHTCAALSSHGKKEKKLEIQKNAPMDFASFISAVIYLFFSFAVWYDLYPFFTRNNATDMTIICLIMLTYVMSRCFCGLGMLTFPDTEDTPPETPARLKSYKLLLLMVLFICCLLEFFLEAKISGILLAAGAMFFFYYRLMALKHFGGINEQLSGWFLQSCELLLLVILLIGCKFYY